MKKQILSIIIGTIVLSFLFGTLQAQTVTLTFTGKDANNQYVQLNRIAITNLTKGWQETIYWPDTTLTMQNNTGIGESVANGGFWLSQNNPNPFTGTTDVNLTVADAGAVTLEIVDGNGRIAVETRHGTSLQPGTHQFRVSLSAAGTYVMNARQNGKTSSIKMVCNGAGNGNAIEYAGEIVKTTHALSSQPKSTTNNPFTFGDQMEYVGYATINGTEYESARISQAQGASSETIVLSFDVVQVNPDGQPCPSTPTVTDIDGNVYNTVQIGTQCWMKENLRTTRYADNTEIPAGDTSSYTEPYRYAPDNNESNVATYGYLYNWPAVMHGAASSEANPSGVQGICPNGWHVPSYAEWTQLTDYVSSQSQYVCGSDNTYIAKALAATTGWYEDNHECTVGNDQSSNNATGFSALPAGYCYYYDDDHYYVFSYNAVFWGATNGCYRSLDYDVVNVGRGYSNRDNGYSVRCLRGVTVPRVTTALVSSITKTSAVCGGNVTNDGADAVTARGICWSTSQNPTVEDSHTTDGTGLGSFTVSITELTPNTTYYVRAYATNSVGTAYGEEVHFTTIRTSVQPCPGTPTLTDIDGNVYNTVQIGNQCWMMENLRSTRYADNTPIPAGDTYSYTEPYRYAPDNNESNVATYGYLYNWPAVMHGAASSEANSSGVQGICPDGWHVPSDAEWTQLTDYVSSQSQYVCGTDNTYIAKALAATTGWYESGWYEDNHECTVGNDQSSNNATGFSTIPVGYYDGYSCSNFGDVGHFWSATASIENYAFYRELYYNSASVNRYNGNRHQGFSVRCVRGETTGSTAQDGQPCPGTPTLTDIDGNVYHTVTIGNQCWMKENLRTAHYANNTAIPAGETTSNTEPYRYAPNYDEANVATYGYLYNWPAVMHGSASSMANPSGVQGICPNGWHVPSDAEWTQLTDYVSSQSQYVCGSDNTYIAKALATATDWYEDVYSDATACAVANDQSSNNATGFSTLPAGHYNDGYYGFFSRDACFWSSTAYGEGRAYYRAIFSSAADVYGSDNGRAYGFSVRCLRD